MAYVKNLAKIGLKKVGTATTQVSKVPGAVVKKAQFKSPLIDVKNKKGEVQSNMGNLYTGKKANPLYVAAAGAAWLGGKQMFKSAESQTLAPLNLATKNDFQQLGAPDIMMYDGVGQQQAPQNMNAEGSLVFGLHNMRKG